MSRHMNIYVIILSDENRETLIVKEKRKLKKSENQSVRIYMTYLEWYVIKGRSFESIR